MRNYNFDKSYLQNHTKIIELTNGDSSIIIAPEYQSRIMTSTCKEANDVSFGWINYDAISSKEIKKHINVYGGEERFWLGPEGGQFSIYFKGNSKFEFENWQVPKELDTESFSIVSRTSISAKFEKKMKFRNYSGTEFNINVQRNINLLSRNEISKNLQIKLKTNNSVGYETINSITNIGNKVWNKKDGVLSIWMLGMMNPSSNLIIIVPINNGDNLGKKVNDNYFGEIPSSDLKITDNVIYFKGDGKRRGKIGISKERSTGKIGSYDAINNHLTIIEYTKPVNKSLKYVNSAWKLQNDPYSGDVINSYNDGPLENGEQLGPFYEIETSSPAAELKINETTTHIQKTYHFTGSFEALDKISTTVLGVSLKTTINIFNK